MRRADRESAGLGAGGCPTFDSLAHVGQPGPGTHALDEAAERERRLVETGVLRPGLPNAADVYRGSGSVKVSAKAAEEALDWTRGDR